jgi:hypothetical protein
MKFYFFSFKPPISDYAIESAKHAESTGDAQEKSVRSYELALTPN